MLLSDYGFNVYSQFGEDGMIEEVFKRLPNGNNLCVEFGASNGLLCSNTANLWKTKGWRALLIESEPKLFFDLVNNVNENCICENQHIEPTGENSIDTLINSPLTWDGPIDLMSIDVDGADFWIFNEMKTHPRLVVIEYNPTVPPHIDIHPSSHKNAFGVGALTMKKAAEVRGYTMIGLTATNLFFVRTEDAESFSDLETDLTILLPPERFMYLATDIFGRIVPMGDHPPWGLHWPPSSIIWPDNNGVLLEITTADVLERLSQQLSDADFQWTLKHIQIGLEETK